MKFEPIRPKPRAPRLEQGEPTATINLHVTKSLMKQVDDFAYTFNLTRSEAVRRLLEQALGDP